MSGVDPHIGLVTWDYKPPLGGMGHHVRSLASGLVASGSRVSVFSRSDLRMPFGRSILFSLLLSLPLRRWITKNRPDVLHVHAGPGGVFLLRKPNTIPLVVTANHTYADQVRFVSQQWKRFLLPFERRTYRLADRILCLSNDTAFSLMHDYGIAKDKLTVVGCGIDVESYARVDVPLASRAKRCVFVGRSDRRKGFDLLLAAWKIVSRQVPDASLTVIGVDGLSTERVHFARGVSDTELAALIGAARIAVCPSRLEGFGLAAAEAIAAGTPVVATDSAGLRSVVRDFETGLLSSLDPLDLAEKMTALLCDDALWQRLHAGCVRHRNTFAVSKEIERHRAVYDSLYTAMR